MKKKEKPKDEIESQVAGSGLPDFYELLDTLLPQSSKLLRDTLEKYKECLEKKSTKEKDGKTFLLELEKEKAKCVLELLGVAIDQYQRVSADYANFQKRVPKQTADSILYEKEKIIKSLLPVLDNFEHTLQNAHSAENADILIKGIQIIYDQMLDILKSHGVEQIKAIGEIFDPTLHEAIMQKTQPQQKENIVLEVFQKGYKLNGRVIRPSRVVVNKLQAEQTTGQISEQQPQQEKSDSPQEQTNDETTDVE